MQITTTPTLQTQVFFSIPKVRENVLSIKQLYRWFVPTADVASVLDLLISSTSLFLLESLNSSEYIILKQK